MRNYVSVRGACVRKPRAAMVASTVFLAFIARAQKKSFLTVFPQLITNSINDTVVKKALLHITIIYTLIVYIKRIYCLLSSDITAFIGLVV